ncbi:hypothetical protein RBI14_08925 [Alcaligenaceae bacterium B3P038]|nr:hypothetical protein [Alcaligenaceae bacterium B3P038]
MHKLLIVGHPSSRCDDIEALLNDCGMASPSLSKNEKLTPVQINEIILKASRATWSEGDGQPDSLAQLTPSDIWQGLVLDLMLGNVKNSFWGWSDPNSLSLLDYWKRLDPNLKFVFVYSRPSIGALSEENSADTDQRQRQASEHFSNWTSFNSAMLNFYYRNRDRSVLVNTEEALSSARAYVSQMRTRLNAPLDESKLPGLTLSAQVKLEASTYASSVTVPDESELQLERKSSKDTDVELIQTYFDNRLIENNPEVVSLFEELQSVATLTISTPKFSDSDSDSDIDHAWAAFTRRNKYTSKVEDLLQLSNKQLQRFEEENASEVRRLKARLISVETQMQTQTDEVKFLKNSLVQQERHNALLAAEKRQAEQTLQGATEIHVVEVAKLIEESETLVDHLHSVQEELERLFIERSRIQALWDGTPKPIRGAADVVKNDLPYRIGALMLSHYKTFNGIVTLPFRIRKMRQQMNEEAHSKMVEGNYFLDNFKDRDDAEKVKSHLSYLLGIAYLKCTNTPLGWLCMPGEIRKAIAAFNRRKIERV